VPQQVQQATAMLAIAACEPNAAVSRRLGRGLGTVRSRRKRFTPNAWPRCATAINMMTVHFAGLLPNIRINAADPGLSAIRRGTPTEQAHLMEQLNEVFRARRSVNITDDVENITGTAPATFCDWSQRHADAFL
jgi:hypothetical protein